MAAESTGAPARSWRSCCSRGCDHGKRRTEPQPPAPKLSFVALDREHQRLVRDYEPVSCGA